MFGAYAGQYIQGTHNVGSGNWCLRFAVNGNENTACGYKAMAGTPNETSPSLPMAILINVLHLVKMH